ncbi:MAG: glycosyltransferase family 2 protein [Pseudomonadota bacterium]|nr:glycosyltransferase family 2 protein [Pseudomonadota bacterium]MDE3037283.1 glycosyltransferase family 2 protein [Pseudomonadota bacterium]
MTSDVVVSYIVTVYNKEAYVGHTADSLLTQEGGIPSEYIFVDDVSTDRSLEVLEERARGVPNVVIVRNSENKGPSIRVNQGARLARGKYLQFIDSDDVLAANATRLMLSLLVKHQADVIHGGWERTDIEAAKLVGRRVDDNAPYVVSDRPREFVFRQRLRRMMQLVRRETFLASGGCDERVFIQDESLGLRLARTARRIILLKAPVLLIPRVEGVLSANVSQLNHDRFLASYHMLKDFCDLDEDMRRNLYGRCISAAWKERRHRQGVCALASRTFLQYLRSKWRLPPVDDGALALMNDFFAKIEGVKRTSAYHD